jgi:molybdopterin-guanine dinucleotide biosynthesis protein A
MNEETYQTIEQHIEWYFFASFPNLPSVDEMMEQFMAWDEEFWLVYKGDLPSFKQDFYETFNEIYQDKKALCN